MAKRKKKSVKVRLKEDLDKEWRSVGKKNACCAVCATLPPSERVNYSQLHAHHIIGRRNAITRYDLRNRLFVCPSHHTLGKKTVEYNEGGWFWDKSGDTGWMGKHRLKDKRYLSKLRHQTKKWTITELRELLAKLTK